MYPLNDYILIELIKESKTNSGFITNETGEFAIVENAGDCEFVKKGDKIAVKSYDITDVEDGANKFSLIKDNDILGKCE